MESEIQLVEKSLIGIILQKPQTIAEIQQMVVAEDFSDFRAAKIYRDALAAFRSGAAFDLVIAASSMPKHAVWLAEAHDVIPINYREYASKINNEARCRRIKEGALKVSKSPGDQADDLLRELSTLHRSEQRSTGKTGAISDVATRTFELIEKNRARGKMHGVRTGFYFLDEAFVRYVPGHMWLITGFTSAGKTTLAIEMLSRVNKSRVMVISTEMTEEQLVARMVSRETGLHNQKVLSGMLEPEEYDTVLAVMARIKEQSMAIVDDRRELQEIEGIVMQQAMSGGVDVVFLDYVQQIRCKGVPRKEWGAEAADRIQELAKRARTCIVCFSQVSNQVGRGEVEQLEGKGAGEWAACADVGVRLRRDLKKDKYLLGFDMQKGRHYGTLQKDLQFKANFTRIDE